MGLTTKLLPTNLLNMVKRSRPIYSAARRMRFTAGTALGSRFVAGLDSRAHYNDFMLNSTNRTDVESYRRGAQAFVDILGNSIKAAGRSWDSIGRVLEVGCGYGRIIRELRSKVPSDRIDVCDVIDEGARFTAAEFGVRRVPVIEQVSGHQPNTYDLIYLLSVYTHLPLSMIEENLSAAARTLKSGGVIVFTTHGFVSASTAERYNQFWLDKPTVLNALSANGYYYERYPYYYAEYGLTWLSTDQTKALVTRVAPDLKLVRHDAGHLDGHQDVFVFQKA